MNTNNTPEESIDGEPDAERNRRIRERAYQLWEADGRPEGRADTYWHRACELAEDEGDSSVPPTQSRGNRD
jgi:hypothetical protein